MNRIGHGIAASFAMAIGLAAPAQAADPVADFYAGKTVHVLIGYSVGGGYDLYARLLAKYMGAGSLKVVNYIYNVAPKDGTAFATFGRGLAMEPLLKHSQGVQFDAVKLGWLGSATDEVSICAFTRASGIKSYDDLKNSKKTLKVGGTGSGSDTNVYATLMMTVLKAPLKLITGFPGGSEVNLALQRGELDGRCGWSWSSLISQEKSLYDNKEITIIAQMALKKHTDLPDVPLMLDLAPTPKDRAALKLILARQTMARPYAAPPGVPAERLAALRAAFDATMEDKGFLAEAEQHHLEVRPTNGQEVEALIKELYANPPDVIDRAIEAMKGS
jgi:tripartite-type tricarboxylate transporter receptor subunit TctC